MNILVAFGTKPTWAIELASFSLGPIPIQTVNNVTRY